VCSIPYFPQRIASINFYSLVPIVLTGSQLEARFRGWKVIVVGCDSPALGKKRGAIKVHDKSPR